jgi:hypothetical protein
MKELGSMKIPNQDFKFDLKVANLSMKLRDIVKLYLSKKLPYIEKGSA